MSQGQTVRIFGLYNLSQTSNSSYSMILADN
jgi:hypothetical protein